MKNVLAIPAFLLCMFIPSAHAELVELKWSAGAFAHKATVAPKKFLEVCGRLTKSQQISWRFNGSAPTDFNIHYHVGDNVVYPEQRRAVGNADGVFTVPLDQDFCWMWTNKGAEAVTLEVKLTLAGEGGKS